MGRVQEPAAQGVGSGRGVSVGRGGGGGWGLNRGGMSMLATQEQGAMVVQQGFTNAHYSHRSPPANHCKT